MPSDVPPRVQHYLKRLSSQTNLRAVNILESLENLKKSTTPPPPDSK